MIWHILKYLLSFSIPSFYRKIQIKNIHYLKNNQPTIIASNHPNAFMDPILFSYLIYPPRVRYMARGDAFKPGLISLILQSIGIVPIFRMQDAGVSGLKKNNESYKIVYRLLKRNKKVMIFAEGICIQEKRLRPIKKGVPRLIYNAQKILSDKPIMIVPVCLNYANPSQLGSDVFINVGEPFSVLSDMQAYNENPNAVMLKMMDTLYQKMLPLTIHIQNPENDYLFEEARFLINYLFCKKNHLNFNEPADIFIAEKKLADVINAASVNYPEEFYVWKDTLHSVFSEFQKHNADISVVFEYPKSRIKLILKVLMMSIVYVLYDFAYRLITGFMYIPYKLSELSAKSLSKKGKEFYASYFLAFSTFIFIGYYLIIFYLMQNYISAFLILSFFVISLSFIPLIHYFPSFKRKFITLLKILKNETFAIKLCKSIEEIYKDYEKIVGLVEKK